MGAKRDKPNKSDTGRTGTRDSISQGTEVEEATLDNEVSASQEESVTPEPDVTPPPESFDVFYETPPKRRKKRGPNKAKAAQSNEASELAQLAISLLNTVGSTLSDVGELTPTETVLIETSVTKSFEKYADTVQKYSGYLYPILGIVALGTWTLRVSSNLKGANDVQKKREQTVAINQNHVEPESPPPSNGHWGSRAPTDGQSEFNDPDYPLDYLRPV